MSVTDRHAPLGDAGGDDLPRTLRREREARERGHPGVSGGSVPSTPAFVPEPIAYTDSAPAQPAVVTAIKVPFLSLVFFFIKAVFAALPAIALLGAILWTVGHLLMTYYPWLVKVQILIRVPN